MLKRFARAAGALLLLAAGAASATDIDSDGFSLDGSTTYCMGIGGSGSAGALTFDTLLASNAGRCPIEVSLSLSSTQFHVSTTFTVSWSASVDSSVTSGIFPNAIDSSTGLPDAVTTSLMWACTAGTNCGTNVAGAPTGSGGSSSGDFDSSTKSKELEDNSFTLTTEGSYIIVGLVQLPGDSSLDISAEEYLVFETITIVSADTEITPTPTTATPSSSTSSATGSGSSTLTPTPTSSVTATNSSTASSASGSSSTPGTVKPSSSSTSADSSSLSSSAASSSAETGAASAVNSSSTTVMLIAIIAGACVVCVIGFIVFMRRRKGKLAQAHKAYDFASPGGDVGMVGGNAAMAKRSKSKVDLGYVANISARNTDRSNDDVILMSDDTCVIMASAERGSELNASSVGSSVRHSSVDNGSVHQFDSTRDMPASASAGAVGGAFAAAAVASASPREPSNVSDLSSLDSEIHGQNFSVDDTQSVSNYGDSVVDESQHNYLQSFDWKQSQYGSEMGDDDKGRGYSTASGYSEFSARDTSLSEDRHSTVRGAAADSSSEYRPTDMSGATRASRLDSEISVDSYTFRPSRESADSYGSGFSMYSRHSSRISGMSNYSDAESTK